MSKDRGTTLEQLIKARARIDKLVNALDGSMKAMFEVSKQMKRLDEEAEELNDLLTKALWELDTARTALEPFSSWHPDRNSDPKMPTPADCEGAATAFAGITSRYEL